MLAAASANAFLNFATMAQAHLHPTVKASIKKAAATSYVHFNPKSQTKSTSAAIDFGTFFASLSVPETGSGTIARGTNFHRILEPLSVLKIGTESGSTIMFCSFVPKNGPAKTDSKLSL